MASKFQNRLVGTIVLVALGVIVLPGLLDGQKKHYQDEFAAIPLVPKPGDRDEPCGREMRQRRRWTRRAWRLTMSSLIRYRWRRLNRSRLKPTPAPQPVADDKPAPTGKAYVVQLGALKNADKVNEIVGKLRSAGFRVYTSPSTPVQGKITRILVGPDASKDKMKGSLGELKQISGLSGVVMGYSPN